MEDTLVVDTGTGIRHCINGTALMASAEPGNDFHRLTTGADYQNDFWLDEMNATGNENLIECKLSRTYASGQYSLVLNLFRAYPYNDFPRGTVSTSLSCRFL